uniref:Uncharacterized protein n=1 Tax=Anguilla anguilla TaxID=7936 RepID=A0A0E9VGB3_ANGAN
MQALLVESEKVFLKRDISVTFICLNSA